MKTSVNLYATTDVIQSSMVTYEGISHSQTLPEQKEKSLK